MNPTRHFAYQIKRENRRLAGWRYKETKRRLSCRDTIDLPVREWEGGSTNRPVTLEGNIGWNGLKKCQKKGIFNKKAVVFTPLSALYNRCIKPSLLSCVAIHNRPAAGTALHVVAVHSIPSGNLQHWPPPMLAYFSTDFEYLDMTKITSSGHMILIRDARFQRLPPK